MEHDKKTAQDALKKSQGHVLVHGRTGTGKSKLLEEATIPDSRYFAVLMKIFTWIIFWMRRNPLSFSIV